MFVGKAILRGYGIYDLGFYPGIIQDKDDHKEVLGEVYEVNSDTLKNVDRLEGAGYLYLRNDVKVEVNGRRIDAVTYTYNQDLSRARKLNKEWRQIEWSILLKIIMVKK